MNRTRSIIRFQPLTASAIIYAESVPQIASIFYTIRITAQKALPDSDRGW